MKSWEKVYETNTAHQAEIVKDILLENEISALVVNKKDSAYLLGHFEVMVPREEILNSIRIINEQISFE